MENKILIDSVNNLKVALNEISVYDFDVYTSMELYYKIAENFNKVIRELSRFEGVISEEIVKQNEKLIYLLGEGLNQEVVNKIDNMVETGVFDTIINHNIFNNLKNDINNVTLQLEHNKNEINGIKNSKIFLSLVPKIDGEIDDTGRLKRALNSISKGVVVLPSSITISENILVYGYKKVMGDYYSGSAITLNNDASIILADSNSEIENVEIILPNDYEGSAIKISSPSYGHTWSQKVKNCLIRGSISKKQSSVGIEFVPHSSRIIMNSIISNVQFRGVGDCIKFNGSQTTNASGGIFGICIKDCWADYYVNGIKYDGIVSECNINNFNAQANSFTEYFIKDIQGYNNRIINSTSTDGGRITINEKSRNTLIDILYNNYDRISDKGWRTDIRVNMENEYNAYKIEKENFIGNSLNPKWRQNIVGTATIEQNIDLDRNPYHNGLILSTGSTKNSSASIDYGKYIYNRFTPKVIHFKFRVHSISNSVSYLGFKSAYSGAKGIFFKIENDLLIPITITGSNVTEKLNPIIITNKPYLAQIIVDGVGNSHFHLNGNYLGTLKNEVIDLNPYFYIENTESANKKLTVTNLFIRSTEFYNN